MQQPITIMLVGAPNVGKSMIFNYLTGMYVTVSNYPGTTVDVSRGKMILDGETFEVVDTPGIYSLIPMTEEERVTRELICDGKPKLIIHVVDAKHIRRMINLTLELLDGDFPVIVDLNVIDEAEKLGMSIDAVKLSEALGVPVVKTSAIHRLGLSRLRHEIRSYQFRRLYRTGFSSKLEERIAAIGDAIHSPKRYGMSSRLIATMLLQGDAATGLLVRSEVRLAEITRMLEDEAGVSEQKLAFRLLTERQAKVDRILEPCMSLRQVKADVLTETVGRMTREPLTGIPILLFVLYFGLYVFVGRFGAGVLVEYFDKVIFGNYLLPILGKWVTAVFPTEAVQTLLMGEFGIFSLGLRYAIAIILPVVGTFFLAFSLLEDSGYLPRLAMLLNGVCRLFGLNGRAVIPLSLGFGCGTMAVMVTRTLESKRERLLATFLLSLAIPCSAQFGIILALLSRNIPSLLLWCLVLTTVFFTTGVLGNRVLPGIQSVFYMELPPIRLPRPKNVIVKAYSRMVWYMREIIPVFLCVSLVLWLAERQGWIKVIANRFEPILSLIGLPRELALTFLLGFFRRDYGAAGLYELTMSGVLSAKQLLVAAIALTLFLPCVAQLVVMVKERGVVASMLMLSLIAVLAFSISWLVNILVNPVWL